MGGLGDTGERPNTDIRMQPVSEGCRVENPSAPFSPRAFVVVNTACEALARTAISAGHRVDVAKAFSFTRNKLERAELTTSELLCSVSDEEWQRGKLPLNLLQLVRVLISATATTTTTTTTA